ncbi:unnamed protein product [Closterium sp. Naga37s-1]|nr:unnamed protein product [Closterium sp. Naga37s-1]
MFSELPSGWAPSSHPQFKHLNRQVSSPLSSRPLFFRLSFSRSVLNPRLPASILASDAGWCGSNSSYCGAGCQIGPCTVGGGGGASSPTPPSGNKEGAPTGLVVGAVVGAVLLLLGVVVLIVLLYKRFQKKAATNDEEAAAAAAAAVGKPGSKQCKFYPLTDVLWATNNWAEANRIGSGGYGDVYKGVSPHDTSVLWAVKRATVFTTDDFHREINEMASKNHGNLVRLLGYCTHMDAATGVIEQILIYEFMHNGDLERWIGPGVPVPLNLQQRLDVLIGVAQGLQYLHSFNIVHRDIKPANVLLDNTMQAKVSDFGLVRINKGTTVGATRVMGTPGYVDPAYSWTQRATPAADVYSFGVVLLTVITGRKALVYVEPERTLRTIEGTSVNLTGWVELLLKAGDADKIKDPRLDAPSHVILRLATLALSCTTMSVTTRPTMARVLSDILVLRQECFGQELDPVLATMDRDLADLRGSTFSQEIRRVDTMCGKESSEV